MDFSGLLIKMVIFAVLLAVGYAGARKGFLTREFSKSASWLLVNVFLVASIINSVLGDRPDLPQKSVWTALLLLFLVFIAMYVVATICMHFDNKETAPLTLILMTAVNNLFVGLPIVQTLCGSEAVFYIGLSCVPYNIFLYSYGVWHLKRGKGTSGAQLKDILSMSLAAAVLSLIIFLLDIRLPRVVTELFGMTASATVPLSMIVIGATLGPVSLRDAFSKKKLYVISLIRLIVFPLLTYAVLRPFVISDALLISLTVIAGCPAGAVNTPLAIQYGYEPEYPSECVMVTTILSMFTLPALLYILF